MQLLDRTEQQLRDAVTEQRSLAQQKVYLEAQLAQLKPNSVMFSDSGERILTPTDRLRALKSELASARRAVCGGSSGHRAPDARDRAGSRPGRRRRPTTTTCCVSSMQRAPSSVRRARSIRPNIRTCRISSAPWQRWRPSSPSRAPSPRRAPSRRRTTRPTSRSRRSSRRSSNDERALAGKIASPARAGRWLPEEGGDDADRGARVSRARARLRERADCVTRKCAPSRRKRSSRRISRPIARASVSR